MQSNLIPQPQGNPSITDRYKELYYVQVKNQIFFPLIFLLIYCALAVLPLNRFYLRFDGFFRSYKDAWYLKVLVVHIVIFFCSLYLLILIMKGREELITREELPQEDEELMERTESDDTSARSRDARPEQVRFKINPLIHKTLPFCFISFFLCFWLNLNNILNFGLEGDPQGLYPNVNWAGDAVLIFNYCFYGACLILTTIFLILIVSNINLVRVKLDNTYNSWNRRRDSEIDTSDAGRSANLAYERALQAWEKERITEDSRTYMVFSVVNSVVAVFLYNTKEDLDKAFSTPQYLTFWKFSIFTMVAVGVHVLIVLYLNKKGRNFYFALISCSFRCCMMFIESCILFQVAFVYALYEPPEINTFLVVALTLGCAAALIWEVYEYVSKFLRNFTIIEFERIEAYDRNSDSVSQNSPASMSPGSYDSQLRRPRFRSV